jgi:hypothetical protein
MMQRNVIVLQTLLYVPLEMMASKGLALTEKLSTIGTRQAFVLSMASVRTGVLT